MGQIVFSSRRGAKVDAAHRPSVATHAKWQVVPPEAALPRPVASLRGLPDAHTSRGTARLATGRGSAVKPIPELVPENRTGR